MEVKFSSILLIFEILYQLKLSSQRSFIKLWFSKFKSFPTLDLKEFYALNWFLFYLFPIIIYLIESSFLIIPLVFFPIPIMFSHLQNYFWNRRHFPYHYILFDFFLQILLIYPITIIFPHLPKAIFFINLYANYLFQMLIDQLFSTKSTIHFLF